MWGHIDDGSCPGQGIGVRTRLENGLSGFILTKHLSDKVVTTPEERVRVQSNNCLSNSCPSKRGGFCGKIIFLFF